MYRQIIKLDGTITSTTLPDLDVSQKEIDVAQLTGISAWPALSSWGGYCSKYRRTG